MKNAIRIIITIVIILCAIYAFTHFKTYFTNKDADVNKAIPVSTSTVSQQDVTIPLQAIGNVQAYATVGVKSLVDGELMQVNFKEGDFVKKGQSLFTIDPRPFIDQLNQANANLARDQAQLENAHIQVERNRSLLAKNYVAQQDFDQLVTNEKALVASTQADQAAIDNVKLQLSYANISAPIDGRTGSLQVNQGNIIKTSNGTTLVTITQINPIYVVFSIPQQYLTNIQDQQAEAPIAVSVKVGNHEEVGKLSFIDNVIDMTTGTIQLKATFANDAHYLWPGQFVKATLPSTTLPNSLLIPSTAVQVGQRGPFVYVVKADNTVTFQTVKLGPIVDNQTVILEGLKLGQSVVTSGQMRLTEGTAVTVVNNLNAKQHSPQIEGSSTPPLTPFKKSPNNHSTK